MKRETVLSKALATVATLLTAFGSVAIKIQPPGNGIQEQLGFIVSFGALIVLLIIGAIVESVILPYLKFIWISIGAVCLAVFIFLTMSYFDFKIKYTVAYPKQDSESYIVGDSLDLDGMKVKSYLLAKQIPLTNYNLLANGEGSDHIIGIWTEDSVKRITQRMVNKYFFVMLFLTIGVFSLTEGVLRKSLKPSAKPTRPASKIEKKITGT